MKEGGGPMDDRDQRFVRAITILHRAFGKEMDDFAIEAYAMGCDGVPMALVERGVKDAVQTAKWMPSPAELCGRVSLRRPGQTKCVSCGVGLSFRGSLDRGYCKCCWYAIGGEREDKERDALLEGEKRKELSDNTHGRL